MPEDRLVHQDAPQVLRMLNTVMTDAVAQQACQPCPSGLSKGAHEIIAVGVQQFFVFQPFTLPQVV
jgi:hypothetical protein